MPSEQHDRYRPDTNDKTIVIIIIIFISSSSSSNYSIVIGSDGYRRRTRGKHCEWFRFARCWWMESSDPLTYFSRLIIFARRFER